MNFLYFIIGLLTRFFHVDNYENVSARQPRYWTGASEQVRRGGGEHGTQEQAEEVLVEGSNSGRCADKGVYR